MILVATQDFLHGKFRFLNGGIYDVPDRHSKYLKDAGFMRVLTDKDQDKLITTIAVCETDLEINSLPTDNRTDEKLRVDDILHNAQANTQ